MPREPGSGPYPDGAPQTAQPVHVNSMNGCVRPFDRCAEFHVYEQMAANGAAPERMIVVQRRANGAPNVVRAPCNNCKLMHANGFYGDAPLAGMDGMPVTDVAHGLALEAHHHQAGMPQANAHQVIAAGVAVGAGAAVLGVRRAVHEHSVNAA